MVKKEGGTKKPGMRGGEEKLQLRDNHVKKRCIITGILRTENTQLTRQESMEGKSHHSVPPTMQ